MKVLVTGGGGYIGSILTEMLLEEGHSVVCLDRFFFGTETLERVKNNKNITIIKDDIRWFNPSLLKGIDVVMDLASLSNDPSGELDPSKTLDINYLGRVRVAKLSKLYGVKRYILASSCSVYGFKENAILDESSPTNPLTTYAKANVMAENDILTLTDSNFTVIALRQATVYGLSPRMRFDLAINGMVLSLFKSNKIMTMRDGKQWRPFVHVRDTARAFITVMKSDPAEVNGQVFNVGSNDQNFQIGELAKLVGDAIHEPYEIEWYGSPDNRSYRVNFDKITKTLGFKPQFRPADGATEVYEALRGGKTEDSIKTRTVEWYKYLLNSNSLMKELTINDVLL